MPKKIYKEVVSYRQIAKNLDISPSSVWEIMDKIKMRFERKKGLRLFMEDNNWDLEQLLSELR